MLPNAIYLPSRQWGDIDAYYYWYMDRESWDMLYTLLYK